MRSTIGTAFTETSGGPAPSGPRLYVGIDVGRRFHQVAAIPEARMENGSWERAPVRRIATSGAGFRELTSWLETTAIAPALVRIGCEPTGGGYSRTVAGWLERHGYEVQWLQNWAIHDRRQLMIGKQAKTDALDARLIARLVYKRDRLSLVGGFLHRPPRNTDALRTLVRGRLRLMDQHIRFRQQLTAVEDVLFPELKDFYRSSVTSSSARILLESFPTPESVAAADPADLYRVIVTVGRNRRMVPRLLDFQLAAADSAGLTDDREPLVRAQHWLLYQLRLLDRQLEDAEAAIGETLAEWPEQDRRVLDSFPGMSQHRQAVLLSCIGDLSTFNSDRQLRKLLGWYPEAYQSGTAVHKHHLGKSGNRIGRHEIWLWSLQMLSPLFPPNPFRTYYQRLRGRGMSGSVAIGHLAGKLISVLFFCLHSGQPYDPVRHARDLGLGDVCTELEA